MAAHFKHKLDAGFAGVKWDSFANVLYLDDVGVVAGAYVEDAGERAGAVGQAYKDGEAASFFGFVAAHQVGDKAYVDVSAGKHDACAACCGGC